jgi:deoxyribonuclease-2
MTISPLNESGVPVDWWFMYKVPKLSESDETAAATGMEYAYYDDPAKQLVASPYRLDTDKGALGLTLKALFSGDASSVGWILYNDEIPGATKNDSTCGHTKGVLGFDVATGTGFWLLHSWPKYPKADGSSKPAPTYGQTFLCVALDLDTLGKLATQMISYQQPQVYDHRLPKGLPADHGLRRLAAGVDVNAAGGSNVLELSTRGIGGRKTSFKVIAKNRLWNDDFWNHLVIGVLKTDLDVETWIRGAVPERSDQTDTYSVTDMKYVSLKHIDAKKLPWQWREQQDHAKWAISEQDRGDWICVGDINRMISQEKRGGCTIAFQDADNVLWGILHQADVIVPPSGSNWSEEKTRQAIKNTVWTPAKDARSEIDQPGKLASKRKSNKAA